MISIVIPLYKVEAFIGSCLSSLENQSYKNFEVIIVNDGSPDKSAEIVEEYMKKLSLDIKLINQENCGASAARNNGISKVKGEYVCFTDSDDMLDTNYLAYMEKEIREKNADICLCRNRTIDEQEIEFKSAGENFNSFIFSKEETLSKLLEGKVNAGIWDLLCKREILGELRFAENSSYSEDLEMVWRLVAASERIVYIDSPLYCYRMRSGSAMTMVDSRRLDGMRLFENLGSYIEEKAPEFYPQYEKYGVARWVWSTVWQEAVASLSYSEFCERVKKYSPRENMKKLFTIKNPKIVISSFLFVYFKNLYYHLIRIYRKNYRKIS